MTHEERERLYADIEKSHRKHREIVDRIAAGEVDLAKDWDELERFNEQLLQRTKECMRDR